jgi:hypothetical protein
VNAQSIPAHADEGSLAQTVVRTVDGRDRFEIEHEILVIKDVCSVGTLDVLRPLAIPGTCRKQVPVVASDQN